MYYVVCNFSYLVESLNDVADVGGQFMFVLLSPLLLKELTEWIGISKLQSFFEEVNENDTILILSRVSIHVRLQYMAQVDAFNTVLS